MKFDRRDRRLGAAVFGGVMLGATVATLSANPAAATGIIHAVTTVSCSVTGANWCISGNNTGSGIGVIGTSKTGTGLRGESTTQYGVKATSGSGTAILAQTTSGADALYATAGNSGTGVGGSGNIGVFGNSSTSYFGVLGESTGVGVAGETSSGTGIQGLSSSGYGGYFHSDTGYGVFANTNGGVSFVGRNSNGNASDIQGSHIGLLGRAPATGFPLVLTDATPNTLFYVDGYGNVYYAGSLYNFASTSGGGKARSFSPNSTQPTIEDSGTAQLVNGVAVVRLDRTFAASIDVTTAYRVFLTPAGDTRGLFVASRTPAGFVVRESQAGRSTVQFDYRILATALGKTGQRMAPIDPSSGISVLRAPLSVPPSAAVPRPADVPAPSPATP